MKKIISIILSITLCMSIVSCSSLQNSSNKNDTISNKDEISQSNDKEKDTVIGSEGNEKKVDNINYNSHKSGLRRFEAKAVKDENPEKAIRRSTSSPFQTVGTMINGESLPVDFYLYRNALDGYKKNAYDMIHLGLLRIDEAIVLTVPLSEEDIDKVYSSVLLDNPDIFWAEWGYTYHYNDNGNITAILPLYNELAGRINETKAEIENATENVLKYMWTLPNDIEKAKFAHDYLTDMIDYKSNENDQNIYSSLVQNKTVCTGYSKAFEYMMHKMGIPCTVVTGDAGELHAWNILELQNDYYMMDVTWDDPLGNSEGIYNYDYFNITEEKMAKDHTREVPGTELPNAYGTYASFDNYFGGNSYGSDFTEIGGSDNRSTENKFDNYYDESYYDESYDDEYEQEDYYYDYDDFKYGDYEYYDFYDDSDYYTYDENTETEHNWWNLLDDKWTKEDWDYDPENDLWVIYDTETDCYYLYNEEENMYGCYDTENEGIYWLDDKTGEWLKLDEQ